MYISLYVSHYNRNYVEKYIVNQKILNKQNVFRIRFYICCANFITIGEPPIVLYICIYIYIYMKTIIVIISKNKSKNEKFL